MEIKAHRGTAISGYGEIFYQQDFKLKQATANLKRVVLFVGHRFSDKITFFSEFELENAIVTSGGPGGEFSVEQAFMKFDLSRNVYVNAGFFSPRIGIINENHLPTTFNGNERPVLETQLIPTTWREIGAALYANVREVPGLNLSVGISNGLNAAGLSLQDGIGGARQNGFVASARNKAVTAAVLYYTGPWRLQASGYAGGSVGLTDVNADFIGLNTGMFGTPIFLYEANAQYRKNGLSIRLIATQLQIPDAADINTAFANNAPEVARGAYAEVAYDVLDAKYKGERQLVPFLRYEYIDMNAKLPENGRANPYYSTHHAFAGIGYFPVRAVGIKADYHFISSGEFNKNLIINPPAYMQPFYTARHFFNLGICYSF